MTTVRAIWIEEPNLMTTCYRCEKPTAIPCELNGSWDGDGLCQHCGAVLMVYTETRGWDVEVYDADGMQVATGELFT